MGYVRPGIVTGFLYQLALALRKMVGFEQPLPPILVHRHERDILQHAPQLIRRHIIQPFDNLLLRSSRTAILPAPYKPHYLNLSPIEHFRRLPTPACGRSSRFNSTATRAPSMSSNFSSSGTFKPSGTRRGSPFSTISIVFVSQFPSGRLTPCFDAHYIQ